MPDINTMRPDTSIYPSAPQNKLMMPAEAMGPAIGVAQGMQNLQSSKFDLMQKQMQQGQQMLGSIVANPSMDQVTNVAKSMATMGVDPKIIAQGVQEFAASGGDPAKIREIALNHLMRHADIHTQMQAGGAAPPQLVDNGQTLNPVTVQSGIRPGIAPAAGGPMQKYLSPEGAAQPVTGPPTAAGAPTTVPLGGYAERSGQAKPGTYTRSAPAPQAVTAPPMATGLSPGEPEAMKGSTEAYVEARSNAGRYVERVNPLRQAIPLLEKTKETEIGPQSERWNDLKSTVQSLGAGPLLGINPEKIKDYNELKKYLTQYTAQAAAAMSPKTNDGLASAVSSNPNMHMDKLSATELTKAALGLERMKQAAVIEFKKEVAAGRQSPSGAGFQDYMVDFSSKQDPRAYVYDLLSPDQQKKLKESLSGKALGNFVTSGEIAHKAGVLGDVYHAQ